MVERVELDHEDHEHQENRGDKRPCEEDHRFLLVFRFARKGGFDPRGQVHCVNRAAQSNRLIVHQNAGCDVRFDRDHAFLIHARDRAGAGAWLERHEVRDRHQPCRGRHAQRLKLLQRAFIRGKADVDVDGTFGIVGAVIRHGDAARQQLYRLTQGGDIGPEPCCFGTVNCDAPLHPRQGARIRHIGETTDIRNLLTDLVNNLLLHFAVMRFDPQIDGLSASGSV